MTPQINPPHPSRCNFRSGYRNNIIINDSEYIWINMKEAKTHEEKIGYLYEKQRNEAEHDTWVDMMILKTVVVHLIFFSISFWPFTFADESTWYGTILLLLGLPILGMIPCLLISLIIELVFLMIRK
jgi:hypothetical protein